MKYLKEAAEFLRDIKKTDGVVIVFNNDGDGICSCVLVSKLLEKKGCGRPYIISQPMPMDKNLVQRIKTSAPSKIIFLDLVVDQQEDVLKKVRGLADVLIIDHHQIGRDMNGGNVTFFNPRFTKSDIYQSTSYCAYKVCSEIEDIKEEIWISAVGIISDYETKDSMDIINEAKKKYSIDGRPYDSFLGRIADMIPAARATKMLSCEQIVEMFLKTGDPERMEKTHGGDKLVESLRVINTEIEDVMKDAEISARKDENVVSYSIKSRYNIDSIISTKLSEKHRDKLVMVWSIRDGKRYKISARNQDKNIGAGDVMKKACQGLRASGGGHEAAAGATVDSADWEPFMNNVRNLANKKPI